MNFRDRANCGLLETIELPGHRVRRYGDRIAVWRRDGERLSWEELQAVKQRVWGDRVAVEVYPAERDVVNLRHTRHLWSTPELAALVAETCRHPEFEVRP